MMKLINYVKHNVKQKYKINIELEIIVIDQMKKKIIILSGGYSKEK